MKKFALALVAVFVLAMACGGETPEQVIQKLIDGVQSCDGDVVVGCLSAEIITTIDMVIEGLKADPEGTAAMAATEGIEITAEEVTDLTAARVITIILSSETSEMPDLSNVVIGEAVIDGQTATVPVTMDGDSHDIELILEDGKWKIGGDAMNYM